MGGQITACLLNRLGRIGITPSFRYFPVLMCDQATGMVGNCPHFRDILVVCCIESKDARRATPGELSWPILQSLAARLTSEVHGCERVLYDITQKPPAIVEFIWIYQRFFIVRQRTAQ